MLVTPLPKAMTMGYSAGQIHRLTKIDCWFLEKLMHIEKVNDRLKEFSWLTEYHAAAERSEFLEALEAQEFSTLLLEAKTCGFSDFQIARALGLEAIMNTEQARLAVRRWRQELGITPTVNQIDTLAAEHPARTNYLYLSYLQRPDTFINNKTNHDRFRARQTIPSRHAESADSTCFAGQCPAGSSLHGHELAIAWS